MSKLAVLASPIAITERAGLFKHGRSRPGSSSVASACICCLRAWCASANYGILGNNRREHDIANVRAILERGARPAPPLPPPPQMDPLLCPHWGRAGLRLVGWLDPYGIRHIWRLRRLLFDSS